LCKLVDKLEDNEIILIMQKLKTLLVLSSLFLATSCYNKQVNVVPENSNKLTLGKIQQTLKKGIAQDQIVIAMGSPNLVTVDSAGLETWIYDKISTEVTAASASNSATVLGGGIGSIIGVGGAIGSSGSAAKKITSQKTLTVVLKFKDKKLESYTYNASKF